MAEVIAIDGLSMPRYAALENAFRENFSARDEIGAAIALVVDGELVVDLWGGFRDAARSAPWEHDTLVNVWSTTKGVTAACFAIALERGLCDYEERVSQYWPEFACEGKGDLTVAELLSHQAGLSAIIEPATVEDLFDTSAMANRLAAQEPLWKPGSASGYHAITVGYLATALFERIEGRGIGRFVEEEWGKLDIQIGLSEASDKRTANIVAPRDMSGIDVAPDLTELQAATLANPPLVPEMANDDRWRRAEIPSANGHATARGLAQLYAGLVRGSLGTGQLVSAATLEQATRVRSSGVDLILQQDARWAAGFLRNSLGLYGPSDSAFGHSGWGGSFAFADPENGIAFAYIMNRMGTELVGEPRALALVNALYD